MFKKLWAADYKSTAFIQWAAVYLAAHWTAMGRSFDSSTCSLLRCASSIVSMLSMPTIFSP